MKQYIYRLWRWLYKGIPIIKTPIQLAIPNASCRLKNRHILITGGSKGIGYQTAKRFIDEGASVTIVSRHEQELKKAAIELHCNYLVFDLRNITDLSLLIDQSAQLMGGLDGLVNNAGICNIDNGFRQVTENSYDEQFILNVKSPFFLTQAFVNHVINHKVPSSGILFVTSERGLYPDDTPYGMTKAAIGNIIAGIARKYAVHGINCNGIAPGVTANPLNQPNIYTDAYLKGAVGKRYILPEEIAEVAVFLMADASSCISGEIIPCNQGNHYK